MLAIFYGFSMVWTVIKPHDSDPHDLLFVGCALLASFVLGLFYAPATPPNPSPGTSSTGGRQGTILEDFVLRPPRRIDVTGHGSYLVQPIFAGTWIADWKSRDSKSNHTGFKIVKIEQIENKALRDLYNFKRAALAVRRPKLYEVDSISTGRELMNWNNCVKEVLE